MSAPVEVVMPQVGESMREGEITRWLVQVGTVVERDQPLFEISTDKVDAEVPSPHTGVLSRVLYPEGTTVPINTVVALIEDRLEASSGQQIANTVVSSRTRETRILPTKEEQDTIVKLSMAIYANLMGTLDAEEKVHDYTEGNESGTDIYRAAAREAFHRAEWFIAELRDWKQRIDKVND